MAQLGRFTHTAASSTTGHPVSGASVTIYREGATVSGDQSGVSPLTVTVRHYGKVKVSDTVFVWTPGVTTSVGSTYNVSAAPTATTIVLSGFVGTLSVLDGDFIVPTNSQPSLYNDDQAGGTAISGSVLTTSTDGLAQCFVEFGAYSYIVSGGGPPALTGKLFHGMVSGSEAPGQVRYADAFAKGSVSGGIQEAVDDLPSGGGKVLCSGGRLYSLTGTTAATASIWLHSGVELVIPAGATIQRAPGSLTTSIGVICGGPKGSNGTEFSSGTTGSNISITGAGIIDGAYTGFASNIGHGIRLKYVDGILIDGPTIKNTQQDGIYLDSPLNFHLSNIHLDTVGQATSVTQRNGISIYNTGATSGWGQNGTVSNITIKTVGAAGASAVGEGISTVDVANVAFTNIIIDGCDYALELNAHNAGSEWNRDLTFSNIVVKNARFTFIPIQDNVAAVWTNIAFSNLILSGHATLHNGGVLWMSVNTTGTYQGLSMQGVVARNINTSDTANRSFIHHQSTTAAGSTGISISNCQFYGKSGSTVLTCAGMSLNGGLTDVVVNNTLMKDIPGLGYSVGGITAVTSTARNVIFNNCIADTCTGDGFKVSAATITTTQYDINFNNCIAKDCGISGNNSRGWFVTTGAGAGSIVSNIHLTNCRAYQTAGTFMLYGINITATAASALGPVYISDCDFNGVQTAELVTSGTITGGLHCNGFKQATQAIAAAGDTITLPSLIAHCHIDLTSNNTYTLSANPIMINGGFNGQRVTIMNVDTTDVLTFTDGNNIQLNGGVWVIGDHGDNIVVQWSDVVGDWVQVGGYNNIT